MFHPMPSRRTVATHARISQDREDGTIKLWDMNLAKEVPAKP